MYCFFKKNASVETNAFGSELMTMKQAIEYLRGLRCKLRMFEILVNEPACVYGDNQSVLVNTPMPASMLKKKFQATAFYFVCEGCAADDRRMAHHIHQHAFECGGFHDKAAFRGEALELC